MLTAILEPTYESEFNYIEGEVDSPYGLITVKLNRNVEKSGDSKGTTTLRVTIPFGTTATIKLPPLSADEVADRMVFVGDEKIGKKVGGQTIELSHGIYTVVISSICRKMT